MKTQTSETTLSYDRDDVIRDRIFEKIKAQTFETNFQTSVTTLSYDADSETYNIHYLTVNGEIYNKTYKNLRDAKEALVESLFEEGSTCWHRICATSTI
jgi:hypothetical protein